MRNRLWIGMAAVLVIGAAAGAVLAEGDGLRGFGFRKSHVTEDRFDLSVGFTASGRPQPLEHYVEDVVHVVVPSHYGDLYQITPVGNDAVLWFRNSDGTLRNAFLDSVTTVPYSIERAASTKVEIKLR